ncbi:LOW QUALITY PROTEIN: uncharacterized protein ACR2FA_006255 [Aphomia sociella]
MRLHLYPLFLFAFIYLARAAKLPALDVRDKKLAVVAQEAAKEDVPPVDNSSSEQELIDQTNAVNEVENNLRVKIKDIPVKVVVENIKSGLEVNENTEKNDEKKTDDSSDIKRVEIDLNNPGLPQRQEHDTQNPEHFEEQIPKLKENIIKTQETLTQGFQGVTDWIANNDHIHSIQSTLQNLEENVKNQLQKINETVQLTWGPSKSQVENESVQKKAIGSVEVGLKSLENSFKTGLKALSEKLQVSESPSVRADGDGENTSSGSTTEPSTSGSGSDGTSTNPFIQALQNFQNTVSQSISNVTTAWQNYLGSIQQGTSQNNTASGPGSFISGLGTGIQNIFNQQTPTTPAAAQSDENSASTSRPGLPIWQGIQSSIQNILSFGQNQGTQSAHSDQPVQPDRPIAQAIQNNPIVQGVVNLIQPNRPGAQQPQAAKPTQSSQQEGTNAVPADTVSKPEQTTDEKKPEQSSDGPIKKIIQNNPIVVGITGAVQKFTNPEKPRDTLEGQESQNIKGGFYPGYVGYGGHGGHGHGGSNTATVSAWSNFVNSLIGTITAGVNGTTDTISTAVNSAINTLGTNIQVPYGE